MTASKLLCRNILIIAGADNVSQLDIKLSKIKAKKIGLIGLRQKDQDFESQITTN